MKILISTIIFLHGLTIGAQIVESYEVNAEFFPNDAQMWGYAVSPDAFMRANSIVELRGSVENEVNFYLHGELKIDSILENGRRIEYSATKEFYPYDYSSIALKVTIEAVPDSRKINIHYSGFFNPSRARALSNYMRINRNEGVYLRAYGYSLWFPVFIESNEQSYEANFKSVNVKLPLNFRALVVGELIEEYENNDNYHATWKPGLMDITEVQCSAGEYNIVEKNNVVVYHYDNEGSKQNAGKILDYVIELKQLFSDKLIQTDNDIPIYINEMPKYGDISSENVVGIQTRVFNSFETDIYSKLTIAHELVHPYVQYPISRDNEFYALIIEGFPGFFQFYAAEKTIPDLFDMEEYMKGKEVQYLEYRRTGKTRRGNTLPKEKPILEITADEIGVYKDRFVLNDRVHLFMYDLWMKMGDEGFDSFLMQLFELQPADYSSFEKVVLNYLPGYKAKLNTWLKTTDYPESLRVK